ncbi:hypothetical protein [Streptomyces enissocaesilis]|uniref:rhamnogalacturonan lyase family protein n=1 Tax=Streptomyces enissocaesilis TaxID=332589 RepID=UPI0031E44E7D
MGHGDALHVGDPDPARPGPESFHVHEHTGSAYAYEMHDAKTGAIVWGGRTGTDVGRGICADPARSHAGAGGPAQRRRALRGRRHQDQRYGPGLRRRRLVQLRDPVERRCPP